MRERATTAVGNIAIIVLIIIAGAGAGPTSP